MRTASTTPRSRAIAWLMLALVLALLGPTSVAVGQQPELVLRMVDDLLNMDPAQIVTAPDHQIAYVVYSGLVRQKQGSVEIVPDLATRWDVSADGLVYTFALRRGVKWHKGFGDFTAEDVKYSFDRIMNPATRSRYRADFSMVKSVETVDPYTVRITLADPYPAFLSAVLAYRPGWIVNRKALEQYGRQYMSNVVGTGPYVFERYIPGEGVYVVANRDYYGPAPKIQRAMFRVVKEDAVAEIALQKGDVHVAYIEKAAVAARLAANRAVVTRSIPLPRVFFVHFNMTRAPFNDVRVRRAMSYAVDKKAIVQGVFLGQAVPTDTILSPGMVGYISDVRYDYDPARAKDLLSEAGFPTGKTFEFVVLAGWADWEQMAAALQQQWRKVGVNVKLTALEEAVYQERRLKLNFDLLSANALRFEPDQILASWFHGAQIPVPNASSYKGADALIEGARMQLDPKKRLEFYAAAQRRIQADAPVVPLLNPKLMLAWRPEVKGVEVGFLAYQLETMTIGK
jgi:peptide/nickel transport system substrate-binding protein